MVLYNNSVSTSDTNFVHVLQCQIDNLSNGFNGIIRPLQFLTTQFNAANSVPNSYGEKWKNNFGLIMIYLWNTEC